MVLSCIERSQSYTVTRCHFRYSSKLPFHDFLIFLETNSYFGFLRQFFSRSRKQVRSSSRRLSSSRSPSFSSGELESQPRRNSPETDFSSSIASSVSNRSEALSDDTVNGEVSPHFGILLCWRMLTHSLFSSRPQTPTAYFLMSLQSRTVEDTTTQQVTQSATLQEAGSQHRKIRKVSFVLLRMFASFVSIRLPSILTCFVVADICFTHRNSRTVGEERDLSTTFSLRCCKSSL